MEKQQLTQAIFTTCDEDETAIRFLGLHDPKQNWNGWAIPFFTEAVARQILEAYKEYWSFTFENDTFFCREIPDPYPTEEPYTWPVVIIDGEKYYSIGGQCWTWSAEDNKTFKRVDKSGRGGHYDITTLDIRDDENEHEDDEEFLAWLYSAEEGDEYTEFNNRKYICLS